MSFTKHIEWKAITLAKLSELELSGYTAQAQRNKDNYLSSGRSVLRAIAKHYGLVEHVVSVNRAGVAVSGDITLIGMFSDMEHGIYIHMSEPRLFGMYTQPEFYYRSVSHIKDYTGGTNQTMTYEELASDLELACDKMKSRVGAKREMV